MEKFDVKGYLAERQAWWDEKAKGIQQARKKNWWSTQTYLIREYFVVTSCEDCGARSVLELWMHSPEHRVDLLVEAGENGIIEEECFDCQFEDWCDILESDEWQEYLDEENL